MTCILVSSGYTFWIEISLRLFIHICNTTLCLKYFWELFAFNEFKRPNSEMRAIHYKTFYTNSVTLELCHSHLSTEQLMIYISALYKLRESAEISSIRYTNLKSIVHMYWEGNSEGKNEKYKSSKKQKMWKCKNTKDVKM